MKRVVLGLVVILAVGLAAVPGHAFLFGNCCCAPANNQCCAVAPYEVHVSYTPIQPQPGECTYCTCLPYGCPDWAPVCPPCGPAAGPCGAGSCGAPCAAPCAPCAPCVNLAGLLQLPCCVATPIVTGACGLVGSVLDCACGMISGVLNCLACCSPCSTGPCGAGWMGCGTCGTGMPTGMPVAQ
jgi:hypothetical protein